MDLSIKLGTNSGESENSLLTNKQALNVWSNLPDEYFEGALVKAMKSSNNASETFLWLSRIC